jgi:RNA 3'-terminal phosphate cyclase
MSNLATNKKEYTSRRLAFSDGEARGGNYTFDISSQEEEQQ